MSYNQANFPSEQSAFDRTFAGHTVESALLSEMKMVNMTLHSLVQQVAKLEARMDNIDQDVQRGIEKYYRDVHSSQIVDSLVNGMYYLSIHKKTMSN